MGGGITEGYLPLSRTPPSLSLKYIASILKKRERVGGGGFGEREIEEREGGVVREYAFYLLFYKKKEDRTLLIIIKYPGVK